jgi:WD40 repeat protein
LETTHTGHGDFVTAVAWPNDKNVLSVSRERKAQRWGAQDDKKAGELSGWDSTPTRLIVLSNRLFSAAMDKRVREHDLESKEIARTFDGARDAVYSLALHAASQRLAAGTHEGVVHVWNTEDGRVLAEFRAAPGHPAKFSRAE